MDVGGAALIGILFVLFIMGIVALWIHGGGKWRG